MSRIIKKINEVKIDFIKCPYCGGAPEFILVPGEDFVMRCSVCHASTQEAKWTPKEAADDWNKGDIKDDNFEITADTLIDEFFVSDIKDILLSEYSIFEKYPLINDGYLCSEAVIITEKIMLVIEPENAYLFYDEINGYGDSYYKKSIAAPGTDIKFMTSKWMNNNLISLEFRCDNKLITISADATNQCMAVHEQFLPL